MEKSTRGHMLLWTLRADEKSWTERNDPFVAISEIATPGWEGQVLITSEQPESDKESICAVLKVIRGLREDVTLIVGTPHPVIGLIEIFRNCGAHAVWAVNLKCQSLDMTPKIGIADMMVIDSPVCPALHLEKGDPVELSVCGKRNNRLILVMRYFRKWCLAHYEECPYWRGTCDDCQH